VLYGKAAAVPKSIDKKALLQQSLHFNKLSARTAAELSAVLPRDRSASLLRSSLTYSPQNAELYWGMAEASLQGDNPGEALYWVRRSLHLDPFNYSKRSKSITGMLLLSDRRLGAGDIEGAKQSAVSGLELLRQYRLRAEMANGVNHNDRQFHLTEEAVSAGRRLESLLARVQLSTASR